MKRIKNKVSKTTKTLFKQVSDLLDNKINQASRESQLGQRNVSRARIFGSEINFGTDPAISLAINTINGFLNQISLTPIIINGLIITQNTPADTYVNISLGTALYAGKVFELQSDISNLEIPLDDNPNTTTFYIQLTNVSGGYANVSVNTSELPDSCTIGLVRVPVAGDAEDVIDQKDYDNTADSAYIDNRQQVYIYDDGSGKLQETSIDFFRNNDNISDILVDNDVLGIWFKDVNDNSRGYIRGGTSTLNYSAVNRHWFTGAEVYIGDDEAGLDFVVYGDSSGQKMVWDASENSLFMYGDILMQSFEEGDPDDESTYDFKLDFDSSETGCDDQKIWGVYDASHSTYALFLQAHYRLEWWATRDQDSSGNRGVCFQAGGDAGAGVIATSGAWWSPNTEDSDYVVGKPVGSKGGSTYWNEAYLERVIFNDSGETNGTAVRKAYIDGASEGYLDYYTYTAHRFYCIQSNTDLRFEYVGTDHSGLWEWMEDEDYFKYSDDILLNLSESLYFRDTDNSISSADADHLDIVAKTYLDLTINSVQTSIASISTGTSDNDKLVTKGYVDDAIDSAIILENLWDRESGGVLVPYNANDSVDLGSGNLTTTGIVQAEHLYTTDDLVVDDDATISGQCAIGTTPSEWMSLVQSYTKAVTTGNSAYGLYMDANFSGGGIGCGSCYGLYLDIDDTQSGDLYRDLFGIRIALDSTSTSAKNYYSMYGQYIAVNHDSTDACSANTVYGQYTIVDSDHSSVSCYGNVSSATGIGSVNYAYYANAQNASSHNYSFYGASGDIYNAGNLEVTGQVKAEDFYTTDDLRVDGQVGIGSSANNSYGLYIYKADASSTGQKNIYSTYTNTYSGNIYGAIYANYISATMSSVSAKNNGSFAGLALSVNDDSTSSCGSYSVYGIYSGVDTDHSSVPAYAIYGSATGLGTNCGVCGSASGGTTNYSFYGASGSIYSNGSIYIVGTNDLFFTGAGTIWHQSTDAHWAEVFNNDSDTGWYWSSGYLYYKVDNGTYFNFTNYGTTRFAGYIHAAGGVLFGLENFDYAIDDSSRGSSSATLYKGTETIDSTPVSDQKYKENIVDTKYGLSDLNKLKVRDYNYKDEYIPDNSIYTGCIAQEVETVYPFAVKEVNFKKLKGNEVSEDVAKIGGKINEGYIEENNRYYKLDYEKIKIIDYKKLIPLLIKSVQDLSAEVENLKKLKE